MVKRRFNVATFRKRNKKEVWLHSLNKSIFGVLTKVFCLKRRQEICIMKQSQSRRSLVHHLRLLTWWSDKLSELCKIHSRKRTSPLGIPGFCFFYFPYETPGGIPISWRPLFQQSHSQREDTSLPFCQDGCSY